MAEDKLPFVSIPMSGIEKNIIIENKIYIKFCSIHVKRLNIMVIINIYKNFRSSLLYQIILISFKIMCLKGAKNEICTISKYCVSSNWDYYYFVGTWLYFFTNWSVSFASFSGDYWSCFD